jgi:hypothetical protein
VVSATPPTSELVASIAALTERVDALEVALGVPEPDRDIAHIPLEDLTPEEREQVRLADRELLASLDEDEGER